MGNIILYNTVYNDEDLYKISGKENYFREDLIRVEKVSNNLRYHDNKLQQEISICHSWKDNNCILGIEEEWCWVWVDVPTR